ncbi:MAG: SDR family NAD(P)-dependent oxidoreductase [Methyloprofundus sp.]|nr:SDR family NAD(P)-dependent oxidoreductase [Methyloprofundus sp.]
MQTVLITGANRGLGLEFCQQYAQQGWRVLACCRKPDEASALQQLATEYTDSVQVLALDVVDHAQIDALAIQLHDISIDVLISNAGVYGDTFGHGFGQLDYQNWRATFEINVLAGVKMAEAFNAQLLRSQQGVLVAISSLMGSMADNGSGGSILYRSSKAALNAAMKSLAIDLQAQGVGVLIFHPGWVKTDMGGQNALIDTQTSIQGMRQVIAQFDLAQTGSFIKYDGSPMPW